MENKRARVRQTSPIINEILATIETEEWQQEQKKRAEEEAKVLNALKGKTTKKDIDDLHHFLVDAVCKFCKERGLTDVDAVSFHVDGLIGSIPYGSWQPCTDSSMHVKGLEYLPDYTFPTSYDIGFSI